MKENKHNLWPRISVVTPSYNQVEYLEQTIASVLSQGYPNLEYIIVDGGSSDGSVDIIRRYCGGLAYWVSEPDRGQAHAINKGFERATGEVLAWLNSDDLYLPGALRAVGRYFRDPSVGFLHGNTVNIDKHGKVIGRRRTSVVDLKSLLLFSGLTQPATFWRRSLMNKAGRLDETLRFCMDFDLWCRMAQFARIHKTRRELCAFRFHEKQKTRTMASVHVEEHAAIVQRYLTELPSHMHPRFLRFWCILRHYLCLEIYWDPLHCVKGFARRLIGPRGES